MDKMDKLEYKTRELLVDMSQEDAARLRVLLQLSYSIGYEHGRDDEADKPAR
jgi:hypothetical protein